MSTSMFQDLHTVNQINLYQCLKTIKSTKQTLVFKQNITKVLIKVFKMRKALHQKKIFTLIDI
jgi:hypothetical protein